MEKAGKYWESHGRRGEGTKGEEGSERNYLTGTGREKTGQVFAEGMADAEAPTVRGGNCLEGRRGHFSSELRSSGVYM